MVTNGQAALLLLVLLLSLACAVAFVVTAASTSSAQLDSANEFAATTEPAPADRTTALVTQFAAGVRGSRAPPALSA